MGVTTKGLAVAGLEGDPVHLTAEALEGLASRIGGRILSRGDDGWEEAVTIWNGMASRSPALVVQPESSRDVAHTVDFARERGLLLGVKCGGHHIAGIAIAEGGVNLDMARMREVRVDPDGRRAHVEGGCRLGDVDRATQEHGLATPLGFISETGVAGLTLGGGLGYLTRRFGWTVDNLEEVEVVTADGQIRIANRGRQEDLFWALRGGGGNFGVVTRFTFRLHEVGPEVVGGIVAWPFDRADEVLPAYRALTARAPRELSVWLMLMRAPPLPFVPDEWHGRRICAMAVCYSGHPATADEALAPIRALGDPIVDLLRKQPFTEIQSYLDQGQPKGMHQYWKTEWLPELTDELLTATRDLFAECPVPGAELGYLHLGGALNERAWDDGAVGNRDARYAVGANGTWEPDDPHAAEHREWIRKAWSRLRPFSTGGNYINFQASDEGAERIRATYGANLARLVEVKRRYDPANVFRVNRNVPPAS